MRITEFFVSNFGIFSGSGTKLPAGLTVFQGENESGKTTLMNFFRRLLFGRGRTTRGRANLYEPVHGGRHGGTARIRMESGEEFAITLDGNKNFISPADGGPMEELSPTFFSVDREVYETVFAIGLGEMQSLDPLNSDDVAARFFAAGAGLGSASLPKVLAELDSKQNGLYRPGGNVRSASAVNRLLIALGETDGKIRELRERNSAWGKMKDDLVASERAAERKKEEQGALEERAYRLQLLEKARPSKDALRLIEERKGEMEGLHPFPKGGIARLDRLKEDQERLRATIAVLKEEGAAKEEEKAALKGDPILGGLGVRQDVEDLEQEVEQFRSALARQVPLEKEIALSEGAFRNNLANLCSWWTEDHLAEADVSAGAIDFARKTAERKDLLERKKGEGEKSFDQWNRLRDDRRSEAASLEREMAAVEKRAKGAAERWDFLNDLRDALEELQDEEQELAHLEEARGHIVTERDEGADEEPPAPGPMAALLSGTLMAVGCGGIYQAWLTSERTWFFGAAALFFASVLAFLAHKDQLRRFERALSWWNRRMDDLDLRMEEVLLLMENQKVRIGQLKAKGGELAGRLGIKIPVSESEMDDLLEAGERDNAAGERFAVLSERSRQMVAVLSRMDTESETMGRDLERTCEELDDLVIQWSQWLDQKQFDKNLAPKDMEALVPRILQLRAEKAALEARKAELKTLDRYVASVRLRILTLWNSFSQPESLPAKPEAAAIRALANLLRRAEELQGEIGTLERDLRNLTANLEDLREDLDANGLAVTELLSMAGVEEEGEFRSLAARWEEKENLLAAEAQEHKVLLGLFGDEEKAAGALEELMALSPEEAFREKAVVREGIAALEEELEGLADSRGRLALRIEQIAADERLGELLFERKELERKIEDGLKEWLSAVLAKHFLEVSRKRHERERQPEVVKKAGEYLALMTANRYTLLSGGETGFSVVLEEAGQAGKRKEEVKWSSGLGDQVYLSMRLALAGLWGRNSEPLPLILDDLLVRFDETRQQGAAEAILRAAEDNQVLLFTCQRQTLDIFRTVLERHTVPSDFLAFHHIEEGSFRQAW